MVVLSTETILRRKPDLLMSMMDGEAVMLDVESGHYFGLSGAGPHIWSLLEQDRSVVAIVAGVRSQFAVGADDAVDREVTNFLNELVDKGLIEIVG